MRNRIAKPFSALYAQTHADLVCVQPHSPRLVCDHIKDFRSICAHDERIFSSKASPFKRRRNRRHHWPTREK